MTAAALQGSGAPTLSKSKSGLYTLRVGDEWLEDPMDPVEAARGFVRLDQLEGMDRVVLLGSGLGYRAHQLRELGAPKLTIYEPNPDVLATARDLMPTVLEACACFTEMSELLDHLTATGHSSDRIILLAPPSYCRAYPWAESALADTLRDAQAFSKLKENGDGARVKFVLGAAVQNIAQAARFPAALALGKPLAGLPAFIVSAGPSLDLNGSLLADARRRGPVIAVNTSARPVVSYAGRADVVVTVESLDVTPQLAGLGNEIGVLALDLCAHEKSFDLPGCAKTVFLQRHAATASFARHLGVRPLRYGAGVATAAFSLAHAWGANPIVLIGQDLAFTGGRSYAKGTGRELWRVERRGDWLHIDYDEATLALFEEKGLAVPTGGQPRVEVEAWGGGVVDTLFDLTLFRRWFEGAGCQLGGDVRLINATEGGARIAGFEELPLAAVLEGLPEAEHDVAACIMGGAAVSKKRVQKLLKVLRRGARAVGSRQARQGRGGSQGAEIHAVARALGWSPRQAAAWILEHL